MLFVLNAFVFLGAYIFAKAPGDITAVTCCISDSQPYQEPEQGAEGGDCLPQYMDTLRLHDETEFPPVSN